MKIPLTLLILFAFIGSSFAAPSSLKGRALTEVNAISTRVLQRSISPWFYQSLLVSPIEGHVIVRAQLSSTKLYGGRVIRSDLDGAYDPLALQLAKELKIAGDNTIDNRTRFSNVLLHLLIYKVADGTMALSFASLERAGGEQLDYFGCAKLAVLKEDGMWTEIMGPASLHGKGLVVMPSKAEDIANAKRTGK